MSALSPAASSPRVRAVWDQCVAAPCALPSATSGRPDRVRVVTANNLTLVTHTRRPLGGGLAVRAHWRKDAARKENARLAPSPPNVPDLGDTLRVKDVAQKGR